MKWIIWILFISQIQSAYSYVDLSLSYTYSNRRIDGIETDTVTEEDAGEAVTTSTGISATWAWYIWEYTALEFNYSSSNETLTDTRQATDSSGLTIKQIESVVKTEVSGVGLRQSFASRKARIIPSLSLGYAQLTTEGTTTYTLQDGTDPEEEITIENDKEVSNSGYVAFQIRFRLTELMGLTLAARSVMPDFDTELAENNLTYSAGFSWVF